MLVPDVRYTTLVIKAEASDTGQKIARTSTRFE